MFFKKNKKSQKQIFCITKAREKHELHLQTRRQYCVVISLEQNTALRRDIERGFVMSRFGPVLPAWIPALRRESGSGSENVTLRQDESSISLTGRILI